MLEFRNFNMNKCCTSLMFLLHTKCSKNPSVILTLTTNWLLNVVLFRPTC